MIDFQFHMTHTFPSLVFGPNQGVLAPLCSYTLISTNHVSFQAEGDFQHETSTGLNTCLIERLDSFTPAGVLVAKALELPAPSMHAE